MNILRFHLATLFRKFSCMLLVSSEGLLHACISSLCAISFTIIVDLQCEIWTTFVRIYSILIYLHILALGEKINSRFQNNTMYFINFCCKLCKITEMQSKILNHNMTVCYIVCIAIYEPKFC